MSTHQFIARHDGDEKKISVERTAPGHYRVVVDGVARDVDARAFAAGTLSLLIDDRSYDVELEVAGDSEAKGSYNTLVHGEVVRLDVLDERKVRMGLTSAAFAVEGPQTVTAPMPGKVVELVVKLGDEVEEGAPLVIMEAMKMENELKSPKSGKISAVFVEKGAAVEAGAKLISVE
ncbi:MAG: biotin/lipoyl-containing protein [Deltaproteobacteria bacterium]